MKACGATQGKMLREIANDEELTEKRPPEADVFLFVCQFLLSVNSAWMSASVYGIAGIMI
jgi:hypothetical protein